MKPALTALALTFVLFQALGQIDMTDSSMQVIGYWSVGDKQSFDISFEKYKVKNEDTTSRVLMTYEVDVTVLDSTDKSYTIEWFYKNYKTDTENEIIQKLTNAASDIGVVIKTDEFGAIEEVVNWKEVRNHMEASLKPIEKELKKIPEAKNIIASSKAIYSSKEAIELNAIKDAIQFYNFHGGWYKLNEEVEGEMQFANNFGGPPFDVYAALSLDEINEEDDNGIIRMYQSVDSEQLSNATYDYLERIGILGAGGPSRDELPPITTDVWTASRIHGNTGWIIYSIETKEVSSDGSTSIEERIIEIK